MILSESVVASIVISCSAVSFDPHYQHPKHCCCQQFHVSGVVLLAVVAGPALTGVAVNDVAAARMAPHRTMDRA